MFAQHIKQSGKYIQIRGSGSWRYVDGFIVDHKVVDIINCHSNQQDGPEIFPNAEEVYFRNCNGNTIFFNLSPKRFPKVKNLYLDTHFEPKVYRRFDKDVTIHINRNVIDCRPYYKKRSDDGIHEYIEQNGRKLFLLTVKQIEERLLRSGFAQHLLE